MTYEGATVGSVSVNTDAQRTVIDVPLPGQQNGQHYEQMHWSPEQPRLVDAAVVYSNASGVVDEIHSYFGLRSAAVSEGHFCFGAGVRAAIAPHAPVP